MSATIATLVITITDAVDNSVIEPMYECHGDDRFDDFVVWYQANLKAGKTAVLRGYAYNNPTALRSVVVAN